MIEYDMDGIGHFEKLSRTLEELGNIQCKSTLKTDGLWAET
jgi:hypothetical protein